MQIYLFIVYLDNNIHKESDFIMRKTLGITRNRTNLLSDKRTTQRLNNANSLQLSTNRSGKKNMPHAVQQIELNLYGDTMKASLMEDLSTVNTIEAAKPVWLGLFDECQNILKSVEDLRRQMLVNQNKRLTCIKVSQEKLYETKIYDNAKQATKRIKKCQKILQSIKMSAQTETQANKRICKSIGFRLANSIQQATKQLRSQQKQFIDQRKQFEASEKASFLQVAADNVLMGGQMQFEQLIEDELIIDLQARNEQIKQIVQSIYELSDIYRQMSQMVVLQGSLLDRIDENVEISKQAVQKGHLHLVRAQKGQKKTGRCVCGVISVLLVAISILLIILVTGWFK